MRDPFSWAFPLGSLFGILIKVHVLLPLVMLGLILQTTRDTFLPGTWIDASMLMGLLFVTVFVHEMGHCFAARRVEGEASEVLLWPLGGLARVEVPHTPRANFITAMGGPLANLVICITCGLAMGFILEPHFRPPLNPFWYPYRVDTVGHIELHTWSAENAILTDNLGALILSRLFWISWITFLLNVLLIGLPLDGGRMLQCVLWPYVGYRQATLYAIFSGFGVMFVVIVAAIYLNDVLPLLLAFYIYASCKQEWIMLEMGAEESLFGYDFSQGYTSLERDEPPPPKKKQPNFLQRWLQRRAARKMQQQIETQQAEEQRMDELLDKIQRYGKEALTEEEHRFLKRVSDRYRNK